jgi:Tweety
MPLCDGLIEERYHPSQIHDFNQWLQVIRNRFNFWQTITSASFFSFGICSSAVGAGFYGNEEAQKGLQHFTEAAKDVEETISRTESQVRIRSTDWRVTVYRCALLMLHEIC